MGFNFNLEDVDISDSTIFNNVRLSKDSKVKIDIRRSEIRDGAKVLSDIDIPDGEIELSIDDETIIGENVEFMTRRVGRESSQDYQRQNSNPSTKGSTSQPRKTTSSRNITLKQNEKVGLLRRILEMLAKTFTKGQTVDADLVFTVTEEKISGKSSHEKFADIVSGNGKYRGIDRNVARQEIEKIEDEDLLVDLEEFEDIEI